MAKDWRDRNPERVKELNAKHRAKRKVAKQKMA